MILQHLYCFDCFSFLPLVLIKTYTQQNHIVCHILAVLLEDLVAIDILRLLYKLWKLLFSA